jgi:hypothetical protein
VYILLSTIWISTFLPFNILDFEKMYLLPKSTIESHFYKDIGNQLLGPTPRWHPGDRRRLFKVGNNPCERDTDKIRVARWFVFGIFWKPFERKILCSFMIIWYTLWPFVLFRGRLEYLCCGNLFKYPHFGILYKEKSGNPGQNSLPDQCDQKCFRKITENAQKSPKLDSYF